MHLKHSEPESNRSIGRWSREGKMPYRWVNSFCVSHQTPNKIYEDSKDEIFPADTSTDIIFTSDWHQDDWFPHSTCSADIDSLTLERLSRKGYNPAPTIPRVSPSIPRGKQSILVQYHSVFENPQSFQYFITDRTAHQRRRLRKLYLDFQLWHPKDFHAWNKAFPVTLVKSLVRLRELHLHIRHESSCTNLYHDSISPRLPERIRLVTIDNILSLQILPLTNVTVVWQKYCEKELTSKDWSHERNREWAEYFKACYLNPRGREDWQQAKDDENSKRRAMARIMLEGKARNMCGNTRAVCNEWRRKRAENKGKKFYECIYIHLCDSCGVQDHWDLNKRKEQKCKLKNSTTLSKDNNLIEDEDLVQD